MSENDRSAIDPYLDNIRHMTAHIKNGMTVYTDKCEHVTLEAENLTELFKTFVDYVRHHDTPINDDAYDAAYEFIDDNYGDEDEEVNPYAYITKFNEHIEEFFNVLDETVDGVKLDPNGTDSIENAVSIAFPSVECSIIEYESIFEEFLDIQMYINIRDASVGELDTNDVIGSAELATGGPAVWIERSINESDRMVYKFGTETEYRYDSEISKVLDYILLTN